MAGRLTAEDGVSLIEILVAMFIFAILMAGAAASITQSLALTRDGRARSVAANLGERELEIIRTIPPENVTIGSAEYTRTLDGQTYTVKRQADWVDVDATTGPCDVGAGVPRVLRVTVQIEASALLGGDVQSQTVIAPDVGTFDPTQGHISVKVNDRASGSPRTLQVKARDTATSGQRFVMTNARGCGAFNHLPAGTFEVTLDKAGYVDHQGSQVTTQTAGVIPASTTALIFDYDEAASLNAQLVGVSGGTVPEGIDVSLRNTALLPTPVRSFTGSGGTRTVPSLFPFSDGYEVWASNAGCSENDPSSMGMSPETVAVDPGATAPVTVALPTLRVDVRDSVGPAAGVRLVADLTTTSGCTPTTLELGTTDALGVLRAALPYGSWTVRAPAGGAAAVADLVSPAGASVVLVVP